MALGKGVKLALPSSSMILHIAPFFDFTRTDNVMHRNQGATDAAEFALEPLFR